MDLPVMPPVSPMLAKLVAEIPAGMQYEAKWDGFRVIVFRDGEDIEIASRTTKSSPATSPKWSRRPVPSCPGGASSTARS